MGLRFLLVILGVWIVYLFARRYLTGKSDKGTKTTRPVEKMVRCEHCGTHIPESEAVSREGKNYCCPEHADKDQRPEE
ncbi:MAG: PP0621 family protein [Sedimenticola sp.]